MRKATLERQRTETRAGVLTYGYPKKLRDGRWALMGSKKGGKPKLLGLGWVIGCRKIRPGQPGGWISNERCSYHFKIRGKWFSCRGYGEGMSASCRRMTAKPRQHSDVSWYSDLQGARRRKRR